MALKVQGQTEVQKKKGEIQAALRSADSELRLTRSGLATLSYCHRIVAALLAGLQLNMQRARDFMSRWGVTTDFLFLWQSKPQVIAHMADFLPSRA
jgi:hypothetical protein